MSQSRATRTYTAARLSLSVPPLLRGVPAGRVEVHSVFRSAFNITLPQGLVTIAALDLGGLPNGILIDAPPDFLSVGLFPGARGFVQRDRLHFPDARLLLGFAGGIPWSASIPARHLDDDRVAAWRRRAPLVRTLLQTRPNNVDGLNCEKHVAEILNRLQLELATGCTAGATTIANRLIGLGLGLTPSGDDALVGVEAAMYATASPSAGFLAPALLDVESRTTEVAASFLRHAAGGNFAERIHDLIAALLGDDDVAVSVQVRRAVSWGATSGWDTVAGVVAGLDAEVARLDRAGAQSSS